MNIIIKTRILIIIFILTSCSTVDKRSFPKIVGKIKKKYDVSAISCINEQLCLLASDETNYLQSFSIKKDRVQIKEKIRLGNFKSENDIEGLTNDGQYFYAIGSHGLGRKSGKYQKSRYLLFRLQVNQNHQIMEVKSLSLSPFFQKNIKLKNYFKKPLQENGINIEGLAYDKGTLFIGLRSPLLYRNAQVVTLNLKSIFQSGKSNVELISIDLNGRGIRSIEVMNDMFYIISGSSSPAQKNKSSLSIYSRQKREIIENLTVPFEEDKLEGFEIFPDKNALLLVYDSVENGRFTWMKF